MASDIEAQALQAAESGGISALASALGCRADARAAEALRQSSLLGLDQIVGRLLDVRANPGEPDENGDTPLHHAAKSGSHDSVALLLRHKALPDAANAAGETPLAVAAELGEVEVLRVLLTLKADANREVSGRAPLFIACSRADVASTCDAARVLLDHGAKVNTVTDNGLSALHVASKNGDEEAVRLLLSRRAHPDGPDARARSPLWLACDCGRESVVRALLDGKACTTSKVRSGGSIVMRATRRGYPGIIRLLAERGADLNVPNMAGETPLAVAATTNRLDLVRTLVESGCDIYSKIRGLDLRGWAKSRGRPLTERVKGYLKHTAPKINGILRFVRLPAEGTGASLRAMQRDLVERKLMHENMCDIVLDFAVTWASASGVAAGAVRDLASAGDANGIRLVCAHNKRVPVNAVAGSEGSTPLYMSCQVQDEDAAEATAISLLDRRALPSVANASGETPMCAAARVGHTRVLRLLLSRGASFGASGTISPLLIAASHGRVGAVELLLDRRASVDARDTRGRSALHCAISLGLDRVARLLLERKADVQVSRRAGHGPLHSACVYSNVDMVRALLRAGADCDAYGDDGSTPLMLAVGSDRVDVARALVEAQADVHAKRRLPATPLTAAEIAINRHAKEVASYLFEVISSKE